MGVSCAVGCGMCCDPVILGFTLDEMLAKEGPSVEFAREHWKPLLGPETVRMTGGQRVHCDAFDPHNRSCTVHDGGQPPICSNYPWYDEPPVDTVETYMGCSFQAEFRPLLPIVEVR